uniref:Uncharacterized protein n=1 Tax=Arundo donax TaxID=35708 RepID=A0A0A8YAE1_ARUDO
MGSIRLKPGQPSDGTLVSVLFSLEHLKLSVQSLY